jgi:hypothetical protein
MDSRFEFYTDRGEHFAKKCDEGVEIWRIGFEEQFLFEMPGWDLPNEDDDETIDKCFEEVYDKLAENGWD